MAWVLVLGVLGIIIAFFVYWMLMQSTFGAFSIRQMIPGRPGEVHEARVALLNSGYTRQAYRITSGDSSASWVDGVVRSWRDFLLEPARGVSFTDVTDADVEGGKLDNFDVLILPDVTAMSDAEVTRIKAFLQRGGNVWATWTPALYRPDGSWRGWSFMEDVFGLDFVDYVDRTSGAFQAYTDTFPGIAPPGRYLPSRLASADSLPARRGTSIDSTGRIGRAVASADRRMQVGFGTSPEGLKAQKRREAAAFGPLSGYVWEDTVRTVQYQGDYAVADTFHAVLRDLDGQRRRQPAVAVTYYTWNGGTARQSLQVPYPYTSSGIRRMTLVANTPMTAGIPGGYRVKTQVFNPAVRARLRAEAKDRTVPFGFWYDFASDDEPDVQEAVSGSSAAAFGTYGRGRFVYLGFQRSSLYIDRNDGEDFEALGVLFANMLRYLRREPVVWTHDWPGAYTSAAIFAGVGGRNPQKLGDAASVLQSAGVPGTYFVRPDAPLDAGFLQRLYAQGDVGVYGDLKRQRDLGGNQRPWFESARQQLESKIGAPGGRLPALARRHPLRHDALRALGQRVHLLPPRLHRAPHGRQGDGRPAPRRPAHGAQGRTVPLQLHRPLRLGRGEEPRQPHRGPVPARRVPQRHRRRPLPARLLVRPHGHPGARCAPAGGAGSAAARHVGRPRRLDCPLVVGAARNGRRGGQARREPHDAPLLEHEQAGRA